MNKTYSDFIKRFKLLAEKREDLIINTLSNIFSMRIIGNKTHGDLAEVAIVEFINQFMYDYKSQHVGKDLFRAKEHEEDIVIISEMTKEHIPVSLKAYGDGPLQLSTDKEQKLFSYLRTMPNDISDRAVIEKILTSDAFSEFGVINVMPLIYNEKKKTCNIMLFDAQKASNDILRIIFVDKNEKYDPATKSVIKHGGRKHPIYLFLNQKGEYVCEVRYGGASDNALQRGLWTHTKNAKQYFDSLTNGWINYAENMTLVKLFSLALNSSKVGHEKASEILQQDINSLISRK